MEGGIGELLDLTVRSFVFLIVLSVSVSVDTAVSIIVDFWGWLVVDTAVAGKSPTATTAKCGMSRSDLILHVSPIGTGTGVRSS